ncbi:hypothetical protein ACN47E_007897 [Coniothyrium glycines]
MASRRWDDINMFEDHS